MVIVQEHQQLMVDFLPAVLLGGGGMPTSGGTGGPDCSCSCMPMDSDPNRFKIEDPSGRDGNNHIYFNSMAECESRLFQIKAGCGGKHSKSRTNTNKSSTKSNNSKYINNA